MSDLKSKNKQSFIHDSDVLWQKINDIIIFNI